MKNQFYEFAQAMAAAVADCMQLNIWEVHSETPSYTLHLLCHFLRVADPICPKSINLKD